MEAPAKINLYLGVGPLRDDGYHELATVFQALDLSDEMTALPQASGIILEMDAEGERVTGRAADNLAVRAARALKQRYKVKQGVRLMLSKQIPVAGGMAGGSADATSAPSAVVAAIPPANDVVPAITGTPTVPGNYPITITVT